MRCVAVLGLCDEKRFGDQNFCFLLRFLSSQMSLTKVLCVALIACVLAEAVTAKFYHHLRGFNAKQRRANRVRNEGRCSLFELRLLFCC